MVRLRDTGNVVSSLHVLDEALLGSLWNNLRKFFSPAGRCREALAYVHFQHPISALLVLGPL